MLRRLMYLLVPTVICAAITASVTRSYLPIQYQSEAVILVVPQRVPESYVRSSMTTRIEERLQSLSQQVVSRTKLERIIQDFNLYATERKTSIMEDVAEKMRRNIKVQVVRGDVFRISFHGDNPRTVAKVTEQLASFFIEENIRDREVLAEGTSQFLEAQLEEIRRQIVEKERELPMLRAHGGAAKISEADVIDYEVLKEMYKALLAKRQDAKMAANLEQRQIGEQFKLVDPARIPERPIGPSRSAVNMAGAGLGLGLGCIAIVARRKKPLTQPEQALNHGHEVHEDTV